MLIDRKSALPPRLFLSRKHSFLVAGARALVYIRILIRLGNAAIFLIGGRTRDTEPIAILLRSGDVVIMSGPECRRAYHGKYSLP